MKFGHTIQRFNLGDKVLCPMVRATGLVDCVVPTPGGWLYGVRFDATDCVFLNYNFYFADELTLA